MKRLIIVEGLPCSGKSTTARYIAEKLGYIYVDEGTCNHPADYEFHAYLTESDLEIITESERELINASKYPKSGGFIVPLRNFNGELLEKLLQYKIYDFLPWEIEYPIMLDKWREFMLNCHGNYVFNCVLLQNPMCETMMRFGFDEVISKSYIRQICDIIKPLSPVIIYLKNNSIYKSVKKASSQRGDEWLNTVIDYHCNGEYGKSHGLSGFDGYISAIEERQNRELKIINELDVETIVLDDPQTDWQSAYTVIISKLNEVN